jgi:hypothetical protein
MSVGSWILAGYGPLAGAAAASSATGLLPAFGNAAGIGAGVLGSVVATYTAPLIADTAVPVWHEAHRELPFVFASSAACSAGGVGLALAPLDEAGPARRFALAGAVGDIVSMRAMHARLGPDAAEPLTSGRAGRLLKIASALTLGGTLIAQTLGRRSRIASAVGGAALVASSVCGRFGIFYAGVTAADDPRYTVRPQRARLESSRP